MARSNAKTTGCFSAAMGMKASDVTRLEKLAEKYGTGDITGDYVSAAMDAIAEDTQLLKAIQSAMKGPVSPAVLSRPTTVSPSALERPTEQVVQQLANTFVDNFGENAPPIRVMRNGFGVVPGAAVGDKGALYKGTIYIFSDGHTTKADVLDTLWHETFHYGIRKVLSKEQFVAQMTDLAARDAALQQKANEWVATDIGQQVLAAEGADFANARGVEEALADLAHTKDEPTGALAKTFKAVADWLARLADTFGLSEIAKNIRGLSGTESVAYIKDILGRTQAGEVLDTQALTAPIVPGAPVWSKAAKDQTSATLRAAQPAPSTATPNSMMAPNIVAREKIMGKLPAGMRPMARAIYTALGRAGETTLNTMNFTEDLLARANDAGIKSAEVFKALYAKRANFVGQHERSVQAVADMYAELPDRLKGKGEGTVNDFLKQSTMTRKWGYQPGFIKEPVTIDPDMAAAHKALGAEGQKFVEAVFKHGAETLQLKKDTLLANTSSTYDVLIAAAKKDGKAEEVTSLETDKAKSLKQFGSLMSLQSTDPYAPIKRFGNQVVIAVSDKYKAALAEAEKTGSMKEVRALQSSEEDYYVDFVDNDREGDALIEKLRGTGLYSTAEDGIIQRQKDETRDQLFGGSGTVSALNKLRAQIDAEYGTGKDNAELRGAARKLNEMVNELYLSALAESSARKSEMRRKGVAGDIDMVRAFETQGKADANFLGAIKFNEETMQSINDMRREVKTGASEAQNSKSKMFNEIMKRHLQSMEYRPSALSSKLVNLTSKWFLATNPAYYLQNATQPWMMSLPVMAGRHEFGAAGKALAKAYEDIYTDFKDAKLFAHMDFAKMLAPENAKLTDAEKTMLTDLLERGRIDIGLATELGQFRAEGDGKASDAWNKVDAGIRGLQTKMEALNRVTTALAAYRLELAKSKGDAAAASAYADRLVSDTHGDYSSWNAPRMFNNDFGKIALQFKKYQLIQLSLMGKMIKQAFGSAPAPERAMAKRALMFMFGQAAIVGGARAMPFGAIAYMLAAALGDDKEPPEYLFRKWVDNKPIADLLVGGVPALFGVDAQKFGGMGQMLSILPFTDVNLTSRDGISTVGYALLSGPLGGLTLKAADSAGYMANGDYYRGLEGMLPTGFANIMKAGRKAAVGESQKDGDLTMSADDVSYFQTALTAVGVTPEAQTQKMFRQNTAYDMGQAVQKRGTDIKAEYGNAVRDGEPTGEIMARWNKYQADRVASGFERQPTKQLTSSAKAKDKRETDTVGNVQYQKANEKFVKGLATL